MPVGLVLVAHVELLADGVRTLAAQMAPGVQIAAAGGTDDGGVGTSFAKVQAGVEAVDDGSGVAILYDLGSARLTADLVLELLEPDQAVRVRLVDAPLVEGAVAAATVAESGGSLDDVVAAARSAAARSSPDTPEERPRPSGPAVTASAALTNPAGLHARPAAQLARLANGFEAEVLLGRPGRQPVDAASVLAVVALGIRGQEELAVSATGPQAREAVDAVLDLVADGFGERVEGVDGVPDGVSEAATQVLPDAARLGEPEAGVLRGAGVSAGLVVGPVRHLHRAEPDIPAASPHGEAAALDPAAEWQRLTAALAAVDADLGVRAASGEPGAGIAAAQQAMLADPTLREGARARVDAGSPAPAAWWRGVVEARALLAGGEAFVAERAADVEDVGRAVLAVLGVDATSVIRPEVVAGAVVVADDLLPSDVAALADAGVGGLALARGGPTAHATIVARGLAIPLVIGLGPSLLAAADGTTAVLDAEAGLVRLDPSERDLAAVRPRAEALARTQARAHEESAVTRITVHGRRVLVSANVGSLAEARAAVAAGADGVGLLRSELLYVDRPDLPGEDEQAAGLAALLRVLGPRPVTVRTLDAGGDKLLPALALDPWRHGPLGVRGLRYGLRHPDLLRTQLRAILRAAHDAAGEVRVMAPMVTVADEARAFRHLVTAAAQELERRSVPYARPSGVGVMIEVPAAALAAADICAEVDFVSLGSNDLTQYVMAADRTNADVGDLYQPDHPAGWRLYALVAEAARAAGREVAVCGELAGDPEAARRLVDLGVDEVSMAPAAIPAVKAHLRSAYTGQE